jgi:hypothetical protein
MRSTDRRKPRPDRREQATSLGGVFLIGHRRAGLWQSFFLRLPGAVRLIAGTLEGMKAGRKNLEHGFGIR